MKTFPAFALALGLSVPAVAFAQKADLKAEALKDLADMKSTMVKIASEMPEERFGHKPTPSQRTFREQILHVVTANVAWTKTLGANTAPQAIDEKATSKAHVIKALETSFDNAIAAVAEQTAESMLQMMKMPWSKDLESRHHVVYSIITHAWDIYGQMAVSLRLNGRVPPASQRP